MVDLSSEKYIGSTEHSREIYSVDARDGTRTRNVIVTSYQIFADQTLSIAFAVETERPIKF